MKKVIVTGSLAYDYIMDFPQSFEENILPDKLKTLSVSFLVNNFSKNFGGVAGNIAYNLGLLGQSSSILACAGEKDFENYETHLKTVGVDTNLIEKIENEFSANMFLITDKNNCQIAGFYPGAMEKDTLLSLRKLPNVFDLAVIAPTMPQAMKNYIREVKKIKLPYLFDPAQQIPRMDIEDLANGVYGAEILIGNDYEIALISKKTGLIKEKILDKVKILITTLGEKGSLIETKKQKIAIGIAKPKKVIDPTGAGDAYIAGFINGYTKGLKLKICGQEGATLASFAIEKYGTQKHELTFEEFRKRYKEAFGEDLLPTPRVESYGLKANCQKLIRLSIKDLHP